MASKFCVKRFFSVFLMFAIILFSLGGSALATMVAIDIDPPAVIVESPEDGSTVKGNTLIQVKADDGLGTGVDTVEYQIDTTLGNWTSLALDLVSGKYRGYWDTTIHGDGGHNIYIRAIDNAGNETSVSVTVKVGNPPKVPMGLEITEPIAPSNGGYLDLYWNPNNDSDLAGYYVYRSTVSGGPYEKVTSVSTNAYRDSGALNGTAYYYVISAFDKSKNESNRSVEAFGTSTDTKEPGISGENASDLTPYEATITWTTDEPATSEVNYGTSNPPDSATTGDVGPTTSHSVTLTGLQPESIYYYKVRSADEAGNTAESTVLSFTTEADLAPMVGFVNPADGDILEGAITLQAAASDDFGISSAEYTWTGTEWSALQLNSLNGYYEASLDTTMMADGEYTIGARAVDTAEQITQTSINVLIDNLAPEVQLISPNPAEPEVLSGTEITFQFKASDSGAGLTSVDYQLYLPPPGVEVEVAPDPDPAAWQTVSFNPETGYWEAPYQVPLIVTEQEGFLYARAIDESGKETLLISEFGIEPNGREFEFIGKNGESLYGMVTIEPIGTEQPNRIGIEFLGRDLIPGEAYKLTVSGEGVSYTVELTANAKGRGETVFEADTAMNDEFSANLAIIEP